MATRKDLRRAVGDTAGEALVLTATTAGDPTTFVDRVRLLDREDNAPSLVHRMGYFSGGTTANLGHEARVTGFAAASSTLTFAPAAPASTQAGDELEIWSNWARFGGVGALHRMLNEAIRSVRLFTGPQVYAEPQLFLASRPELAIPDAWCEFGGADRQGPPPWSLWTPISPGQLVVREGLRTVQVTGRASRLSHNANVRLWGYAPAPLLRDDVTPTPVDAEWLVQTVTSAVRLGQSWRASDRAAEERLANFWAARSSELRRKVGFFRPGMGVSLPAPEPS